MNFFLKAIYLFNLLILLGFLTAIVVWQSEGSYQCSSITVQLGDYVWEDAVVTTSPGEYHMLVYSYFNGVYRQDGTRTHLGRPVYREHNKYDSKEYETIIGAEIKYCDQESAWVFTHEHIRKSNSSDESACPWLLRSPHTTGFDLLDVSGEWSIWTGVIIKGTEMSITCNECSQIAECNFNGLCNTDKVCVCDKEKGYYGTHCEHKRPCSEILGLSNDTWYVVDYGVEYFRSLYNRPVYSHVGGELAKFHEGKNITILSGKDEYQYLLFYTGSRWFVSQAERLKNASSVDVPLIAAAPDYHAFWWYYTFNRYTTAYNGYTRVAISDPTTVATPIGIDFYSIVGHGAQYGPFGSLYPMNYPPGQGYFRCANTP